MEAFGKNVYLCSLGVPSCPTAGRKWGPADKAYTGLHQVRTGALMEVEDESGRLILVVWRPGAASGCQSFRQILVKHLLGAV